MTAANLTVSIRKPQVGISLIEIAGEITAYAEDALSSAFAEASTGGAKAVVLDFTDLTYMNSSGIGLLVTLLIRANRQKQRLMAVGLNDHYREIFELTRLDEAIAIFDSEVEALAAA
jgi:anti-sigma B factor antagonist